MNDPQAALSHGLPFRLMLILMPCPVSNRVYAPDAYSTPRIGVVDQTGADFAEITEDYPSLERQA